MTDSVALLHTITGLMWSSGPFGWVPTEPGAVVKPSDFPVRPPVVQQLAMRLRQPELRVA